MTQAQPQIVVFSTTWCGDCRRSKRWLNDNGILVTEIDIDQDAVAARYVRSVNNGRAVIPTIVFPDGSILVEPTNAALALQVEKVLGQTTPDAERARAARG
jgi:mycoredoxin